MTNVYARMVFYVVAAMAASFGLGEFDPATGELALDFNAIAASLGVAGAASGTIFYKWGTK